jgi:DNA-directed RNA polymerase specialized sigma24 family protein
MSRSRKVWKKILARKMTVAPDARWAPLADAFPETRTAVLEQAARGEWEKFFGDYLSACWREVVLACRARGCVLDEADDLFQELVVCLMREGRGREAGPDAERGNLPGRYLRRRRAGDGTARFRTVLKQVIQNVLREHLRRKRRRPLPRGTADADAAWIEASVSEVIDGQWVAAALVRAARQLRAECRAARTRGQRRYFDILYLASAEGLAADAIAGRLELDRTTVAGALTAARRRFVAILQELTGISAKAELKGHLARDPGRLIEALRAAHAGGDAGAGAK